MKLDPMSDWWKSMGDKKKQARQGDVFVNYEGEGANPGGRFPREAGAVVLAHGEATGHRHAISSRECSLFAVEGNRITGETAIEALVRIGGGIIPDKVLNARRPVALHHDEHATIKLPSGSAKVTIQRQYKRGRITSVVD